MENKHNPPPVRKPLHPGWGVVTYSAHTVAFQHLNGTAAISSVCWLNDEHQPEYHWEWLISFSMAGQRCLTNYEIKWALEQFGAQDFEEDNHEPGIARKFWCAVDPKYRVPCPCKDETIIKNGDYEYSVKTEEIDPTPWCHSCGAQTSRQCDCGPRAEND